MSGSQSSSSCVPGKDLSAAISRYPAGNTQALDFVHAHLVAGLVLSHKPKEILELGVGSAYLTSVLLEAIRENGCGRLTSVDNFFDWGGKKPAHIADLQCSYPEWNLIVEDESAFVGNLRPETYAFVVSDGDHTRGYQMAPALFKSARPGSILVFHDTCSEMFRLLGRLPGRCRQLGFPVLHFTAKSKPDERTDRGLLVVSKPDRRSLTLDWPTSFYLAWRDCIRPWLKRS